MDLLSLRIKDWYLKIVKPNKPKPEFVPIPKPILGKIMPIDVTGKVKAITIKAVGIRYSSQVTHSSKKWKYDSSTN